jgi:phenylpropionate dioxygenase-like ring-hydroxylating dioxygenase large terminal subunit
MLRGTHGVASAPIDRCPHRVVSVFVGTEPPVVEGDTVRCAFHSQTFNQQP